MTDLDSRLPTTSMAPRRAFRRPVTWLFVCFCLGLAIYFDRIAEAQCVQNGTTVTCTGSLGNVSFNAPAVRTLNVGSLTSTATWVSLTGTGATPGAGGDSHFICTP